MGIILFQIIITFQVCLVTSDTDMKCTSPNVTNWLKQDIRIKRTTDSELVVAYIGFKMDGTGLYSNISEVLPEYGPMQVFADPMILQFDYGIKEVHYNSTTLTLEVSDNDSHLFCIS